MSESINTEFEAYVKAELGDIAVVSEGRFISPKIQNYFKVWNHQQIKITELEDDLQFVERWAVHHGTKPHITSTDALSMIQHYPAITAITKSYTDGKVPDTFNPFARITELEALAENLKQEAQIHAMEAKSANATINEINQFISGATGEPANWHGSQPVKEFVNGLKGQLSDAKQVANDCRIVADNALAEAVALRKDAAWIPVSERLPKEGESVFVFSKYGQSDMADFIGGAWENCWLIDDADDTVTHWIGKPQNQPIDAAIKGEQAA